jgi:hypothetical protein
LQTRLGVFATKSDGIRKRMRWERGFAAIAAKIVHDLPAIDFMIQTGHYWASRGYPDKNSLQDGRLEPGHDKKGWPLSRQG